MDAIWGSPTHEVDFVIQLHEQLSTRQSSRPTLVHLDPDALDEAVGKVNGYESPGGFGADDLEICFKSLPERVDARSLTTCSFEPNLGDGDKIADIAIWTTVAFMRSMLEVGRLHKS